MIYGAGEGAGSGRKSMDKKWWTLVAVCTGTFMLLLDVTNPCFNGSAIRL